MSFQSLLLSFLLLIASTHAFGAPLNCAGVIEIPETLVSDLTRPYCVGLDLQEKIAILSGDNSDFHLVTRAIDLSGLEPTSIAELSVDEIQPETVAEAAFSNSCGLAFITSRIVNSNEVLLIFDNFTALLWSLDSQGRSKVAEVTTDYQSGAFYTCHGIIPGIDSYHNLIGLNPIARILTLRGLDGYSKTVEF